MRSRRFRSASTIDRLEPRRLLAGTVYVVNSLADTMADDGVVTLREAIVAANTNTAVTADVAAGSSTERDRIEFDLEALRATAGDLPLRINLNGEALLISDHLEIAGPGRNLLMVHAGRQSRVMAIAANPQLSIAIAGLTLTGGSTIDAAGAGIFNPAATLTLTDVSITSNVVSTASYGPGALGGAIYNDTGHLTLINSNISGNHVSSKDSALGGGIYNGSGSVTLQNTAITRNTAAARGYGAAGGGIYSLRGTLLVDNSVIADNAVATFNGRNSSSTSGGGVYHDAGQATFRNTTIRGNTAIGSSTTSGGGIHSYSGELLLERTIVEHNRAATRGVTDYAYASGGAIWNYEGMTRITNSIIQFNHAQSRRGIAGGGGVWNYEGSAIFDSVTLRSNTVTAMSGNFGGGIYNHSGDLTLTNCDVVGNQADYVGGGFANLNGPAVVTGCTFAGNSSAFFHNAFMEATLAFSNNVMGSNGNQGGAEHAGWDSGINNILGVSFVRDPSPGVDGRWGTADDDHGDLRVQSS